MALNYCESCGTVEGTWVELTEGEARDAGIWYEEFDPDLMENRACAECGEIGCWKGIPEHDDWDMER